MTDFKATPEQWAQMERSQVFNGSFQACVLELRARVEALEASSKATPNNRQYRSSLLVEVAVAMSGVTDPTMWEEAVRNRAPDARTAIREVAAWIRENYPSFQAMSAVLEMELD